MLYNPILISYSVRSLHASKTNSIISSLTGHPSPKPACRTGVGDPRSARSNATKGAWLFALSSSYVGGDGVGDRNKYFQQWILDIKR